jgi:hypothetical protein
MVKINVKEYEEIQKKRQYLNSLGVDEIIFVTEDGKEIIPNKNVIENFKFTGLTTTDFLNMKLYLKEKFF